MTYLRAVLGVCAFLLLLLPFGPRARWAKLAALAILIFFVVDLVEHSDVAFGALFFAVISLLVLLEGRAIGLLVAVLLVPLAVGGWVVGATGWLASSLGLCLALGLVLHLWRELTAYGS